MNNNDLRATLYNAQHVGTTSMLTTGGSGAAAYHDIALVYNPATHLVTFEFDGVNKGTTSPFGNPHENVLLWGNLASVDGRGGINVHSVEFAIAAPASSGDYNHDSIVDCGGLHGLARPSWVGVRFGRRQWQRLGRRGGLHGLAE